jgi:hypothetical protein
MNSRIFNVIYFVLTLCFFAPQTNAHQEVPFYFPTPPSASLPPQNNTGYPLPEYQPVDTTSASSLLETILILDRVLRSTLLSSSHPEFLSSDQRAILTAINLNDTLTEDHLGHSQPTTTTISNLNTFNSSIRSALEEMLGRLWSEYLLVATHPTIYDAIHEISNASIHHIHQYRLTILIATHYIRHCHTARPMYTNFITSFILMFFLENLNQLIAELSAPNSKIELNNIPMHLRQRAYDFQLLVEILNAHHSLSPSITTLIQNGPLDPRNISQLADQLISQILSGTLTQNHALSLLLNHFQNISPQIHSFALEMHRFPLFQEKLYSLLDQLTLHSSLPN